MANSSFFSQSGSNAGTISTVQSKVDEAEAAKVAAEAAETAAEGFRDSAETHKDAASAAQSAAETARDTANIHKTAAEGFKDDSEGFKDDAAASATAAAASEGDAEDAKADAEKLAVNGEDAQYTLSDGSTTGYSALHYAAKAEDHKVAAETAETNAETAEADAVTAKNDAVTAKNDAVTAKNNAETAETNAETAETNAETAQTAAETARDTAEDHRDDAQKIASNAEDTQYTLADGSTTGYSSLHYKEKAADSATAAAASATTATTQAGISTTQAGTSTTKATEASNSASSAATAQSAAEAARDSALAALDSFDDRYLGVKSAAPTVDNDGNALQTGALFFSSTDDAMKVYDGTQWLNAYASLSGALIANQNLSDLTNAGTARTNLGISTVGNTGAFSDLTGTPTTISGYGITDALQIGTTSTTALAGNSGLTALGISDGTNGQALKTDGSGNFSFGDVATSTAWNDITSKPTTISGFGITDSPTATSDLTNDSGFITSADGGNATTLDGIDSGSFLRSDASDTVSAGVQYSFAATNTAGLSFTNSTYNKSLQIGGWTTSNSSGVSRIRNSSDNLHIDAGSAGHLYLNHYCTGNVYIRGSVAWHGGNDGSGSGLDADLLDGYHASTTRNSANTIPIRDQYGYLQLGWINTTSGSTTNTIDRIYASYDGYIRYVTPATLKSQLNVLSTTGGTTSGTITLGTQNALVANNYGRGLFGLYSATRYQHVWSMGTAYKTNDSGTSYGNMYGLTFTHTNIGTGTNQAISGLSHQLQLRMNGTLHAAIGSGIWTSGNITAYSDRAVKTNLEIIPNALDKVCQLNGYTYDRTDYEVDPITGEMPETRQAGVVAQEVELVLPEVVSGEEGNKAVAYGNMVSILIEAIKELKAEIETLKKG